MSDYPSRPIDEEVAAEIRRLHKRHPKLGRHGLLEALRQDGIWVDAEELERFIEEHNIKPESEWRPLKFRGVSRYFVAPDVTRGDRMKGTFEDD
ncbi:MAG TPA: hypothetical protein VFP63_03145 [Dehalococcoidia bacterium]|nr:hypothetical protein [Dehalococcoidia bacterium]